MKMNLGEFLKKGKIEKIPVDREQVGKLLGVAKRDVGVAEHLLSVNCDASFMHSYNSVLQSARALMFSKGYNRLKTSTKPRLTLWGLFSRSWPASRTWTG
ncbi:MAG: hypothetical protein NT157_01895 [Candidatus Micrarchaeota archaeon]|nr:hypothetical protein [Candidatus Micrarchaeota archaeon]